MFPPYHPPSLVAKLRPERPCHQQTLGAGERAGEPFPEPDGIRGSVLAKPPPNAALWEARPWLTKRKKRQARFQRLGSFIIKGSERSTGH